MENSESLIKIINQLFDLEKKILAKLENKNLFRNIDRIRENFEEMNLIIKNPIGESYAETRTDCSASISGEISDKMIITEVIKPIIYLKNRDNSNHLLQKGVVIVEKQK